MWMLIVETILKFIVAILVVILAIVLHDVFNDRDPLDRLSAFQSERFFTPVRPTPSFLSHLCSWALRRSYFSTQATMSPSRSSSASAATCTTSPRARDTTDRCALPCRSHVHANTVRGQKGAYHFFAGRDATRAFVTGCFKPECLVADIDDLTPEQVRIILGCNFSSLTTRS